MKKLATTLIVATAALFVAGAAEAAPLTPAPIGDGAGSPLIQVRGGCGFGAHRGPFGGCRLNNGPRGDIRRALTGAPRGCPPGLYRGPYGRCRPRF